MAMTGGSGKDRGTATLAKLAYSAYIHKIIYIISNVFSHDNTINYFNVNINIKYIMK